MIHDLIVYTDIWDDIDDALALRYLYKTNKIRHFIVVLYSHESEKRNNARNTIEPFFEKKPIIVQWNDTHIISNFLETRTSNLPLDVFCIGPATNLAHHITTIPWYEKQISKILFQARMKYDWWLLIPDPDSYNYKQDIPAANIVANLSIPLFRVGKYTAYQIWLDESHFKKRERSDIGKILYKEWLFRKKYFAEINPIKYEQVYGAYTHIISFPYDLIAALSLYHPNFFQRIHQENNSCCWHDIEHCFKVDKNTVYNQIDQIFI